MKKDILSVFCSVIIAALFMMPAMAVDNRMDDGTTIPIRVLPSQPQGAPRTVVPFVAEYNDLLNCVVLTCVSPCGDVEVTLESTAGDWYQTVFDTLDGAILIPASGDSGHYTLTIVASDGTTYEGEFYL